MIVDGAKAVFPHTIGVHHWVSITRDMGFTFWACDCLHCFEDSLEKEGAYEARCASRFKQPFEFRLLKALIAQWTPNTSTP